MRKLEKIYRVLLCIMPGCLFLSYHPVMKLGSDATMNFELSVAEIWLVVMAVVVLVSGARRKDFWRGIAKRWKWLLLPAWLSVTILWSLNPVRGVLTVGMLWLIYWVGYGVWFFRGRCDARFREVWLKWFFGSALVVCGWCVVQCVMDLVGLPQWCTLMCDGCTYRMFGFPHPNGFAIEPQFMGNLLLAPAMVSVWLWINKKQITKNFSRERSRGVISTTAKSDSALYSSTRSSSVAVVKMTTGSRFLCSKFSLICFSIITITLFLTFSRGAIYAMVVGMVFMSVMMVVRWREKWKTVLKRVGMVWGLVVAGFLVALLGQGVMTQVSPTSDTFSDGVAKVLNHLSLGIIDVRGSGHSDDRGETVENSVEKAVEKSVEKTEVDRGDDIEKSAFDGYVAESTDTRLRLTGAAVKVWSKEPKTVLVGVGLGGAGQALYNNGLSPAPKEIVQNEYASLLLETGVVGVLLLLFTIGLVIKSAWGSAGGMMVLSLIVAFGVSLVFFSGLPNALHIYLLPVVLMVAA